MIDYFSYYWRFAKRFVKNRDILQTEIPPVSQPHIDLMDHLFDGPVFNPAIDKPIYEGSIYDPYSPVKQYNPKRNQGFFNFQLFLSQLFNNLVVRKPESSIVLRDDNQRSIAIKLAMNIGMGLIGRPMRNRIHAGTICTKFYRNYISGPSEDLHWRSDYLYILAASSYVEYRSLVEYHVMEMVKCAKQTFEFKFNGLHIRIEQVYGMLFARFSSEGLPGVVARIILIKGRCVLFLPFVDNSADGKGGSAGACRGIGIKVILCMYLLDHSPITDHKFHDSPYPDHLNMPNLDSPDMNHDLSGLTWNIVVAKLTKQEVNRHVKLRNYPISRNQPVMFHVLCKDSDNIHLTNEEFMEGAAKCSHITGSSHIYIDSVVNPPEEYNADNNPDYCPDFIPGNDHDK